MLLTDDMQNGRQAPSGWLFHMAIARMNSISNQLAPLQDAHENLDAEIERLRSLSGCCTERWTPVLNRNWELKAKAQGVMDKFCSVEDQLIELHANPDGIKLESSLHQRVCFLYEIGRDRVLGSLHRITTNEKQLIYTLLLIQRPLQLVQTFIANDVGFLREEDWGRASGKPLALVETDPVDTAFRVQAVDAPETESVRGLCRAAWRQRQ